MMKSISKIYNWARYSHTKRRDLNHLAQRVQRGWDDSETYSLDYSLAKLILPRLRRFKELKTWRPADMTPTEWDSALDKMIAAFEFAASDDRWIDVAGKEQALRQEGLDLFAKYYFSLWW